ncbi:MAG: glycerol kinase GlpK [Pseudoxanthomonas sp.]|nr:glycerol kinase GlpK [Pseudoxanthomonas sp.]
MNDSYILALDQGTTSSRAILFRRDGTIVSVAQREFSQAFPRPGWVEHDPREILATVVATIAEALTLAQASSAQVAAIGITNQRETTVVWNRRTGQPVHNAIVWQSRQSMDVCERWKSEGKDALVRARTGLLIDAYFSASKIRWILEQVPGAQAQADRGELLFGTIDSWLLWNLSDGRVHATDCSNASRTLLYDIHRRRWCPDLLAAMDIPTSMLPEVKPSSGVFGHTAVDGIFSRRIPVSGIAGDQQASLFGHACFEPGTAKNTYGTGCFMLMNTGPQPVSSKNGLLTTIAWQIGDSVEYALEGSVFIAGAAIQWLRDGLRMLGKSSDSQSYAERAQGNDGVYFVPAFVGLGAPYWRSDVRGAMFGLTRSTSKEVLVRAVLESLAYQTRDVFEAMQADAGIELKELRADGGAIRNDFIAQFQADVLNVALERPSSSEASAWGAASLAGLAVGFWEDRESLALQRTIERRFLPRMEENERQILYAGWSKAVRAAMEF